MGCLHVQLLEQVTAIRLDNLPDGVTEGAQTDYLGCGQILGDAVEEQGVGEELRVALHLG